MILATRGMTEEVSSMNVIIEMDDIIESLNRLKNPALDLELDDIRFVLVTLAEAVRQLAKDQPQP